MEDVTTNISVGDWGTLGWLVLLVFIFQIGYPIAVHIKNKIIRDDTIVFRTNLTEYMVTANQTMQNLLTELQNIKRPGFRTDIEAIRDMHTYFDKVHMSMLSFFSKRLRDGGVEHNRNKINSRYVMFAEDLAGRMIGYLKHFNCQGKPLSDFLSAGGAKQYTTYLMAELFAIQVNEYESEFIEEIDLEDIHNGLDRCLSELMTQFREFLKTGDSLMEQWDNTNPVFIIEKKLPDNGIEEL